MTRAVPATTAAKKPPRKAGRRKLPKLWELPIPVDVRPGRGWTGQMREMADHIGAYATLSIVACYGGDKFWIPADPARSPFADILDADTAVRLAKVYGGNYLYLPVGRYAVDRARRSVVIAAVRAKQLSGADATKILGTSRTYVAHLVNETTEGQETSVEDTVAALEPRQRDLFASIIGD